MDANNPIPAPAAPVGQVPAMPQMPSVTPAPVVTPPEGSSSSKMIIMLIAGLVIIALIVGGIYFYLSTQQQTANNQSAPIVTIAPSPTPQANLESDINNVNVDASGSAVDNDLAPVNQDLQQL